MRTTRLVALLLVGVAGGPPALADDEAAVESAFGRARAHMEAERWSSAVDALKRLVADNPGSRAVLDRLPAIETDLRRALFRLQAKHPEPSALFCKHAKGFIVHERRLTLDYPDGPESPDWKISDRSYDHTIPFDSDVAVEFNASTIDYKHKTTVSVWLYGMDPKSPDSPIGSYYVFPGACSEDDEYIYKASGKVVRNDVQISSKEGTRELVSKPAPGKVRIGQVQTYRVVRRGTGINVSVDGKAFLVCQDGKYSVLKVGLVGAAFSRVTLRGVVEKSWYLDRLEKRYAAEQAEWEPKGYDRSEVLPKWVLDAAPGAAEPGGPAK